MFLLLVDSLNLDFFINRFLDVKFLMLEQDIGYLLDWELQQLYCWFCSILLLGQFILGVERCWDFLWFIKEFSIVLKLIGLFDLFVLILKVNI